MSNQLLMGEHIYYTAVVFPNGAIWKYLSHSFCICCPTDTWGTFTKMTLFKDFTLTLNGQKWRV